MRRFVIAVLFCLNSNWLLGLPIVPLQNKGVSWAAVDALQRPLPLVSEVPEIRSDRFVGIFYFLTHDRGDTTKPNDISQILSIDPKILSKPDSPLWDPPGPYYWGEPLFGYYQSSDPWLIRRHAMLLVDAGVDTVIFDTTNRITYPNTCRAICKV